jgi:hypothetical protein
MGKAEGELPVADLAAETLPDQRFEIGLIIDAEDLDRLGQWGGLSGQWCLQLAQLRL